MKKSSSYGALVKSLDENDITFPTFVPVVSLEYNSPGHHISRQSNNTSPILMSSRARRISRHVNRYGRPKERGIEDDVDCTHKIQGIGLPRPPVLRKFSFLSSSTPTVPFSTADLLYNSEVSRSGPSADDYSSTDLVYFDRDKDKHKLRDIEANRRPSSRNNSRRSISLEKVNFDGEKEELRPIKNTFPTTKQNGGRANGVRGTLLRNDQILNHKNNVTLQGREPDDLVAMGTIWSPNLQQRNSTTTTSTTTSSKSFSLSSPSNTSNVNPRKGPSATTTRTPGFATHISTTRTAAKDCEPKYTDPVPGASPSFQQRLMELSALEAETVRWERTKKVKKKSKQDRDS